jgi:enoyl-[acyl-carrier-protein] reductase (NADH)
LAVSSSKGFTLVLKHYEDHASLKWSCHSDELGHTGVSLASPGTAAATGPVISVDGGDEAMGM